MLLYGNANQTKFVSFGPMSNNFCRADGTYFFRSGWNRIRPRLEPYVMDRKTERLEREAAMIRHHRRLIVNLRYTEYQRALDLSQWQYLLPTFEFIGRERFARHIDAPVEVEVTAATFDNAFARLPEILGWPQAIG